MSWQQLKAILDERRETAQEERSQPPVTCPNDGVLLDVRDDGVRNCPTGDFTWGGPLVKRGFVSS